MDLFAGTWYFGARDDKESKTQCTLAGSFHYYGKFSQCWTPLNLRPFDNSGSELHTMPDISWNMPLPSRATERAGTPLECRIFPWKQFFVLVVAQKSTSIFSETFQNVFLPKASRPDMNRLYHTAHLTSLFFLWSWSPTPHRTVQQCKSSRGMAEWLEPLEDLPSGAFSKETSWKCQRKGDGHPIYGC